MGLSSLGPTLLIQDRACSTSCLVPWRILSLDPTAGSGMTQTRWISILPSIFLLRPCLLLLWHAHPLFYLNICNGSSVTQPRQSSAQEALTLPATSECLAYRFVFCVIVCLLQQTWGQCIALFLRNKYSVNSWQVPTEGGGPWWGRDPPPELLSSLRLLSWPELTQFPSSSFVLLHHWAAPQVALALCTCLKTAFRLLSHCPSNATRPLAAWLVTLVTPTMQQLWPDWPGVTCT